MEDGMELLIVFGVVALVVGARLLITRHLRREHIKKRLDSL